ncbi:SDR family oxidoreductase [Pseudofrankia inefficax]|uniref:Short-chain dehydrogenase/reductase SDR n=1 Tax=Pseudofrankia inefficax (strain DSM 45817 / CECT 9037 / DDB 130130 / EuI1c) TaxID=298654 RepID=E3J920_PSEI1|nr:SDR family oxidoreductase [Pseudofrankia inefficax]ADP80899.1 short-chain dehydrogenase/reductase SDR [Pseudofrankia inefficax]
MTAPAAVDPLRHLFGLDGKRALVTGGTSGIGLMIARGLLQAGARVVVTSRKPRACDEAVEALSAFGPVSAVPADLARVEECDRLAEEVLGAEPALHILVNNAGATWGAPLASFPASAWDKVLTLNVMAPFWLLQALLPGLRAAASAEDPARVVNVGSMDAIRTPVFPTYSYSASKAAVHQLTRHLARDLGPDNITVNAVAPGPFPSRMMAVTLEEHGGAFAAASPLGRIGRADDMAGSVVFLVSRAASYVTGAVLPVDGGIATTATGM